jgi:hypothetical protein
MSYSGKLNVLVLNYIVGTFLIQNGPKKMNSVLYSPHYELYMGNFSGVRGSVVG